MTRIIITLAAALLAGAAQAAPVREAATGLIVDPPAGYAVQAQAPDQQHAARLSVKRPTDTDGGCQIGFSATAANARFTQPQINAITGGSAWQDAAKAALAPVYDITETRVVDFGNTRGLELQADFKQRRELPPRAQQVRSYFAIMETPRGRTTVVCVADRSDFTARLSDFTAIAHGTTPP
ncbi:hypothetical protein [Roseomonas haemaphysalidis]|uniref:DUF1795 domain-containing protein n=1 Tax=Roseomonas haemaphysalidis TaxID=2768162 RepID=A0ABS3KSE8_9PROT|nr:hypothetical protein [Roseomonas haemaphysalidis]MBO1080399.1 hypothetical protein [Roseomonas haemaphysalidis]